MSQRSQAATSQQKPVDAAAGEQSVLRSAYEYNTNAAAIPDEKKKEGASLLAGPVNKTEQERRSVLIKKEAIRQQSMAKDSASTVTKALSNRKLFVMRHGERLDRVFPGWMQLGWTDSGRYKPYDLNMPMSLPSRANFFDYTNDGPLTEVGYITSQMCGRAMRMSRQTVTQIYSSPALRCLQSAHGLLKVARKDATVQIQVEPGLFEWLGWYKDEMPTFMTLDECANYGYEVNRDYKPIMTVEQLKSQVATETIEAYYKRSNAIIKGILEKHPDGPCNILILCHAPSLDACCRELCNKSLSMPTNDQMSLMGVQYPYCSTIALQEYVDKTWSVAERLLPCISYYEHSNRFNAQFFNRK